MILPRLLLSVALCGCQGEPVASATTDAATSETEDASTADAGELVAACSVEGNLLVNGDFAMGASGWSNYAFDFVPVDDGPCGKGLRLTNREPYSELRQELASAPLKKGTRYHLRALFRDPGREVGQRPGVIARFFHTDDAGDETYTQTLVVQALNNKEWHLVELTALLARDEDRVRVYVLSEEAMGQSFDIGLVSLVTE